MKSKILKGVAIAVVAALAGGTLAGCATNDKFTSEEVEAKIVAAKLEAVAGVEPCEVCELCVCECDTCETCEVCPEPTEVEVEVDNGNLDLVLDHVFDNNGDVVHLNVNDLDDDEVDEIVDRIVFINDIKKLAVDEVSDEGEDELDNYDKIVGDNGVNGVTLDDRDIDRFRLYDDADEIVVKDVDFDDGDADVYVDARFEHDHDRYYAKFLIEFKEGVADDITVCLVTSDKSDLDEYVYE